ncbi:UNVERIFIED_CONTAM: hypothetical protein O8I53_09200 [Campylobacter lari]
MDFPAAALVQSVFMRNYYVTDDDLKSGKYGEYINDFNIGDFNYDTNELSLDSKAKNFKVDIYKNDQKISTVTLDQNNPKINVTFDYTINDKLKLKFYKLTPENVYYESRKYNEIQKEYTFTNDSKYIRKYKQTKALVDTLKNKFSNTDSNFSEKYNSLIEKKFKTDLVGKEIYSIENNQLLDSLTEFKNNINNNSAELIELFSNFNSNIKIVNESDLNKIESKPITAISDINTNKTSTINNAFSNDTIDFSEVKSFLTTSISQMQSIKAIDNKLKELNFKIDEY